MCRPRRRHRAVPPPLLPDPQERGRGDHRRRRGGRTRCSGSAARICVGHRSLDFIHPDDHDVAIASWMEMLGTPGPGRRCRLRHRRGDGSYLWVEITNNRPARRGAAVTWSPTCSTSPRRWPPTRRCGTASNCSAGSPSRCRWASSRSHADSRLVYTNERLHEVIGLARTESLADLLAPVLPEEAPVFEARSPCAAGRRRPGLRAAAHPPRAGPAVAALHREPARTDPRGRGHDRRGGQRQRHHRERQAAQGARAAGDVRPPHRLPQPGLDHRRLGPVPAADVHGLRHRCDLHRHRPVQAGQRRAGA